MEIFQRLNQKNSLPHVFGRIAEWQFWTKRGFITNIIMTTVKRVYLDEVSAEIQDVRTSINTLVAKLSGYLEEVGVDDKAKRAKMKDKSSAFVQKAYDYSKVYSFMIPPFVNMEAYYKNV